MKDRIQKLINDQLGELPIEKTFSEYWNSYGELHASMCNRNIKLFAKEFWEAGSIEKETHNRELLASLIEIIYHEHCNIEPEERRLPVLKWGWKRQIKIIEQSLSLSWSEIVKRLEE